MERPMDGGDEGDTFSFSVAPATTATSPTTTPATTGATRRRGGAAAAAGAGRGAGKTRAAGGRGRGATTGRGRGRGAAKSAAAAEEAPPTATSSGSGEDDAAADEGDVGAGGDDAPVAAAREQRNGTWGRPEQVQQAKEAVVADVFHDLVDDLLREVVFEMHRHVHTLSCAVCVACVCVRERVRASLVPDLTFSHADDGALIEQQGQDGTDVLQLRGSVPERHRGQERIRHLWASGQREDRHR
jgi:hypothetical protein